MKILIPVLMSGYAFSGLAQGALYEFTFSGNLSSGSSLSYEYDVDNASYLHYQLDELSGKHAEFKFLLNFGKIGQSSGNSSTNEHHYNATYNEYVDDDNIIGTLGTGSFIEASVRINGGEWLSVNNVPPSISAPEKNTDTSQFVADRYLSQMEAEDKIELSDASSYYQIVGPIDNLAWFEVYDLQFISFKGWDKSGGALSNVSILDALINWDISQSNNAFQELKFDFFWFEGRGCDDVYGPYNEPTKRACGIDKEISHRGKMHNYTLSWQELKNSNVPAPTTLGIMLMAFIGTRLIHRRK